MEAFSHGHSFRCVLVYLLSLIPFSSFYLSGCSLVLVLCMRKHEIGCMTQLGMWFWSHRAHYYVRPPVFSFQVRRRFLRPDTTLNVCVVGLSSSLPLYWCISLIPCYLSLLCSLLTLFSLNLTHYTYTSSSGGAYECGGVLPWAQP
jgi:lysylphosphatidylglycerol synthetase-like protein (DUF2156 family)